ncbi:aldehyde-activating protein [Aliiroseovarius zhejiangensis]|uniref:Aldehyde-activating protein n=1 Tax=Aliiroseovarius zhejiangensis TaxID=1632025 RepID=A0ABQ3IXA1_9RHOB|nr:GFA family protein [Aliiroseovarius zhejiangensis]GHE94668.1 aldehyde-activating protein [Aliiroseovarius zhejiangensis]
MAGKLGLTGKCLCGAVRVSGEATKPDVTVCHCEMCRRWSAGPFMEVTCDQVNFEGEENIGRVRSSEWAERGFCKACGSNLFYHIIGADEYQLSVGLLDDQSKLQLSLQVFTDSKPSFYEFANKTKMMTGEQVVAAFAPPPE